VTVLSVEFGSSLKMRTHATAAHVVWSGNNSIRKINKARFIVPDYTAQSWLPWQKCGLQ
jgi:hypothetical protein